MKILRKSFPYVLILGQAFLVLLIGNHFISEATNDQTSQKNFKRFLFENLNK